MIILKAKYQKSLLLLLSRSIALHIGSKLLPVITPMMGAGESSSVKQTLITIN